jgi:hypothetical protein
MCAFQSPGLNRFLLFAVYFSKIQKARYVELQDIHGVFDRVFSLFGSQVKQRYQGRQAVLTMDKGSLPANNGSFLYLAIAS